MSCQGHSSQSPGDNLELVASPYLFSQSATAWLIGEAIRHLNEAHPESTLFYQRAIEQLRACSRDLLTDTVALLRQAGDQPTLRWNLFHVLGDAGDASAADLLIGAALEKLPVANPAHGCEGPRDMELLVSTMAIHAVHRIAQRHADASTALLKIVEAAPASPLLIEAVKAAVDLGLRDKVAGLLSEKDRWILDLRRARIQEVFADPEREDGKERGFTPPKTGAFYTAPRMSCCQKKEN